MKAKEKIVAIVKELSCMDAIKESERLQEDLSLDSLAMVTLLIEIEEALAIQLEEKDMNPFDLITVGDVVRLGERYVGER